MFSSIISALAATQTAVIAAASQNKNTVEIDAEEYTPQEKPSWFDDNAFILWVLAEMSILAGILGIAAYLIIKVAFAAQGVSF